MPTVKKGSKVKHFPYTQKGVMMAEKETTPVKKTGKKPAGKRSEK